MTGRNESRGIPAHALGAFAATADALDRHGWAEANAGNLSLLLDDVPPLPGPGFGMSSPLPALAGKGLLVTGGGTRMRDVARDPAANCVLLRFDDSGSNYAAAGPVRPTSELSAHLAAHAALVAAGSGCSAIVHTHPTALIALAHVVPGPGLLLVLERAHTEFALVRDRLAVLPPYPPGSAALAQATAEVLPTHPGVVWPGHGMFSAGPTLAEALDLVEVADKAAEIALLAGAGPEPGRPRGEPMKPGRSLQGRKSPEGIETFYDVRTRDSALPPGEFARLPRNPVHVVLDNIRSAFNTGSIFRLADAARCAELVCCGYTAHPPHHKLEQTALGATASVPWRRFDTTLEALKTLKEEGVRVVAVETVEGAQAYNRFAYEDPVALVFGNEALGLSQAVLRECDAVVDIPVFGYKNSINVAAAAAIVLYDLLSRTGRLEAAD